MLFVTVAPGRLLTAATYTLEKARVLCPAMIDLPHRVWLNPIECSLTPRVSGNRWMADNGPALWRNSVAASLQFFPHYILAARRLFGYRVAPDTALFDWLHWEAQAPLASV